ncbi:phosphate/phosphite/phosphonate ABC transporter substrate-binding protein [Natronobacillus azotifigens]|uniref:Phosphate/phosphite/phosphonate ABC transporter substrate-binding protein n=1 Tax=Natronobacillus azotifigens TaxID=472978 RepID=A0A9J6R9L3_9BACI|nr:phosphate/phosphite/phosphonate ABC transporter substrate-binding protein [Natronobacillus azotifigens]MCZ0702293.1 phosphate/phosphite/phosphonate ABC transporter substrate-binding protein [Natronobacillus azotifigens]
MKMLKLGMLMVLFIFLLAACTNEAEAPSTVEDQESNNSNAVENVNEEEADDRADWPEKFVFGILPTEDQAVLASRFDSMTTYLEQTLGIDVELFFGTNYTALIEAMANGHLHASSFGSFSYLVANERANGEAFATPIREEGGTLDDIYYYAQMITLEETGIDSLADVEGRTVAYADPASTSGHLFPKAMLINELGLTLDNVDEFPSHVVFSGSHEASLYSVLNGDVDVAGVCSTCIERVFERVEDHPNFSQLKVFHESEPIPGSTYVIQGDLPQSFKDAIAEAFYAMIDDEVGREFLIGTDYLGGFIPITHDEFQVVADTAEALNMSPEDLLN